MTQIQDLQDEIRLNNLKLGWRGPDAADRSIGDDIALITSELSEALEAFRICGNATDEWLSYTFTHEGVKFKNMTEEQVWAITGQGPNDLESCRAKPEGVPSEIADAFIRILDFCEEYGIDLAAKTEEKMEYNSGREFRHGGAHL